MWRTSNLQNVMELWSGHNIIIFHIGISLCNIDPNCLNLRIVVTDIPREVVKAWRRFSFVCSLFCLFVFGVFVLFFSAKLMSIVILHLSYSVKNGEINNWTTQLLLLTATQTPVRVIKVVIEFALRYMHSYFRGCLHLLQYNQTIHKYCYIYICSSSMFFVMLSSIGQGHIILALSMRVRLYVWQSSTVVFTITFLFYTQCIPRDCSIHNLIRSKNFVFFRIGRLSTCALNERDFSTIKTVIYKRFRMISLSLISDCC